MSQAKLFVFAAPSGAGKTTLVKRATENNPDLKFSISYTTRPQRSTETDGVDYLFVDKDEFHRLREGGALLEWAEVFDNFYGTSRVQVEEHLADGNSVILEIDWQGAQQVREAMPECVSIFILPPNGRGTRAPASTAGPRTVKKSSPETPARFRSRTCHTVGGIRLRDIQ